MFRGRPVLGGIMGFLCFLFIALDLLFFGIVPLNSPVITILPLVGIVFGLVWAKFAPLGGGGPAASPHDPTSF